jgi:hypothetical protein
MAPRTQQSSQQDRSAQTRNTNDALSKDAEKSRTAGWLNSKELQPPE